MIYEFKCNECNKVEEKMMSVKNMEDQNHSIICPHCGGLQRKIISLSKFSLSGGGWERDGYASGADKEIKRGLDVYDKNLKSAEIINSRTGV